MIIPFIPGPYQGSHRFHVADEVGDLKYWILDDFRTKKEMDVGISCYVGIAISLGERPYYQNP